MAEQFDEIHLLLNVAGILHDETRDLFPEKKLADLPPESVLYNFRVNALGPVLEMKHVMGLLAADQLLEIIDELEPTDSGGLFRLARRADSVGRVNPDPAQQRVLRSVSGRRTNPQYFASWFRLKSRESNFQSIH